MRRKAISIERAKSLQQEAESLMAGAEFELMMDSCSRSSTSGLTRRPFRGTDGVPPLALHPFHGLDHVRRVAAGLLQTKIR
jgi:hypothetical protein